jgi:hypothetical protein
MPVSGLQTRLSGIFNTSYLRGFLPVAGILKKNAEPGLTPNTFAPLILTFGDGAGVRIILDSSGELPLPGPQEKLMQSISTIATIIKTLFFFIFPGYYGLNYSKLKSNISTREP